MTEYGERRIEVKPARRWNQCDRCHTDEDVWHVTRPTSQGYTASFTLCRTHCLELANALTEAVGEL